MTKEQREEVLQAACEATYSTVETFRQETGLDEEDRTWSEDQHLAVAREVWDRNSTEEMDWDQLRPVQVAALLTAAILEEFGGAGIQY